MNSEVLKEYLVKLGFKVDHPELRKFDDALRTAGAAAERLTTTMAKQFVTAGTAVTAALTGIATATLGLMDNVADSDLRMQLFARRMFMSADAARYMKTAADALGVSLEDIVWGPKELQERYAQLVADQKKAEAGFGGGTVEERLKKFRDLSFQFTRLRVGVTELARGFTVSLFEKLFGDGKAQAGLENFVNNLLEKLPRIANELATSLAPTLKNVYEIWTQLVDIAKLATSAMLSFIGAIYGDARLEKGEVTIQNIGAALEHVSGTLKTIIGYVDWLVNAIAQHPIIAKTLGGAAVGAVGGSVVPGVGTGAGALVGGAVGFTAGFGTAIGAFDSPADRARKVAEKISADTGIPASLLFGQFVHETGKFTNRGARELNNFAGINVRGGKGQDYRGFSSLEDFAAEYERLMSLPQYRGALTARTPEEFAAGLKAGGYYTDSPSNYAAGIRRGAAEYNMGGVNIHINQPNATPEEIHRAVSSAIKDTLDKQTQHNLIQFAGVY